MQNADRPCVNGAASPVKDGTPSIVTGRRPGRFIWSHHLRSLRDIIAGLPEHQQFLRLAGQIARCDPGGGAEYRDAVERAVADLALGNIGRGEAAVLLEAARGRLSQAAVRRGAAPRLRLESLLGALEDVVLDPLLDAAAAQAGRQAA